MPGGGMRCCCANARPDKRDTRIQAADFMGSHYIRFPNSTGGQDGLFVLADFVEPGYAHGYTFLRAVGVPDGGPGEALLLFEHYHPLGEVHFRFGGLEPVRGFEQGDQKRLEHVARADHPGGHAVDAGVEVVQAHVNLGSELAAAHQFLGDVLQFVVQEHHVIAVPTNRAADVQQQAGAEHQHRGNLLGNHFGGVVVPGVERQHFLARYRVAHVELERTNRVTFGADAEKLGFHRVQVNAGIDGFGEYLVQSVRQTLARRRAVDGNVLVSVRNPEVGHRGRAKLAAHFCADLAAGDSVPDPEIADAFVGVSQGEAVGCLGVRKIGLVEIHSQAVGLGPIDPALEVPGLDFVALHEFSSVVEVRSVHGQPVLTGNHGEGLLDVGAELGDGASFAGIIAGGLNASSRKLRAGSLEAAHVVSLPAVQGKRNGGEFLHGGVGIHAGLGKALLRDAVRLLDGFWFHWNLLANNYDKVLKFV